MLIESESILNILSKISDEKLDSPSKLEESNTNIFRIKVKNLGCVRGFPSQHSCI